MLDGINVKVVSGRIHVSGKLTDDQRDYIRENRNDILSEYEDLSAMRGSQPEGWGWWSYLLADGGAGSIRGPFPDRATVTAALKKEFGEDVVRVGPLPGAPVFDVCGRHNQSL